MPDSRFQYTSYQNQFQNNYDERKTLSVDIKQETAKDGMAGLQSGNKIWEDWLRTSLNAKVNIRYCMTLKFEWTKSRLQKLQQNLRRST